MLVSPTAVAVVSELLQPEDFYRGSHAHIYRTILEMYGGGETIDSITLTNALGSRGLLDQVGGKASSTRWRPRCRRRPMPTTTPRSCAMRRPTGR